MRPLTEPETKTLFEKLASYCGKGIANLIADPAGGSDRNVFRVQVSRSMTSMTFMPSFLQVFRAQEFIMFANRSPI